MGSGSKRAGNFHKCGNVSVSTFDMFSLCNFQLNFTISLFLTSLQSVSISILHTVCVVYFLTFLCSCVLIEFFIQIHRLCTTVCVHDPSRTPKAVELDSMTLHLYIEQHG